MKNKDTKIKVPAQNNKLLSDLINKINKDEEIYALWHVINVNATERLDMSDHGVIHFQIVSNIALRLTRILHKNNVKMSLEKDHELSYDHAEVVVFLASILHDLGMSISREGHEEYSLFLANNILHRILDNYKTDERTIIISEVLHAIISHRKGGNPYTLEAGIVRVADALDMNEGRSRIAYERGVYNIYSISDRAIKDVSIEEGKETPIIINIEMYNSAGIFQIDGLLRSKIKGSGLEEFMQVKAFVKGEEKKLIDEVIIEE